jgi:hypothetical protein
MVLADATGGMIFDAARIKISNAWTGEFKG